MAERPLVARIRRILKKEEQAMQVSRKAVGLVFVACVGPCGYDRRVLLLAELCGRFPGGIQGVVERYRGRAEADAANRGVRE